MSFQPNATPGGFNPDYPVQIKSVVSNYTLDASDNGLLIEANTASGLTITIPLDLPLSYPVGGETRIMRTGSSFVGTAAAGGVTYDAKGGLVFLNGQFAEARIRRRSANGWVIIGDLA